MTAPNVYERPLCPPGCSHKSCKRRPADGVWEHESLFPVGSLTALMRVQEDMNRFRAIAYLRKGEWDGSDLVDNEYDPDAFRFGARAVMNQAAMRKMGNVPLHKQISCPVCDGVMCGCPIDYVWLANQEVG